MSDMLNFFKRILNPYVSENVDTKQVEDMKRNVEWMIAGLGNPGVKYSGNRHNIGWMVASAFSSKHKKPVMPLSNIYMQSSMRIAGRLVLAIMPTTYMNRSGEAVRSACEFYGIPYNRVVIVIDEYNFPVGKVHIKKGGGDGGHNGMASILEETGSNDFLRLRCGIGKDFPPGGMSDYVLSDFRQEEIEQRDLMINKAVESLETVIRLGSARAMSEINSGRLWNSDEENVGKENSAGGTETLR